jgi:hypothetical protein
MTERRFHPAVSGPEAGSLVLRQAQDEGAYLGLMLSLSKHGTGPLVLRQAQDEGAYLGLMLSLSKHGAAAPGRRGAR